MKGIPLREHEVRQLQETGAVTVIRPVKFPQTPSWMQLIEHEAMKTAYKQPSGGYIFWDSEDTESLRELNDAAYHGQCGIKCPFGTPGEQRYVKETWYSDGVDVWYADSYKKNVLWSPSTTMPQWASRFSPWCTDIQVMKLQNTPYYFAGEYHISLWNKHNKQYPYDSNPWVWVAEYSLTI